MWLCGPAKPLGEIPVHRRPIAFDLATFLRERRRRAAVTSTVQAFREFCQLKSTNEIVEEGVDRSVAPGPLDVNGTRRNVLGRGSFTN